MWHKISQSGFHLKKMIQQKASNYFVANFETSKTNQGSASIEAISVQKTFKREFVLWKRTDDAGEKKQMSTSERQKFLQKLHHFNSLGVFRNETCMVKLEYSEILQDAALV